jgi:hypothetical protein
LCFLMRGQTYDRDFIWAPHKRIPGGSPGMDNGCVKFPNE